MSAPAPITKDISALGIRTHTAFDLEKTLVLFLRQLFSGMRLDNPAVNFLQATRVQHPMEPPAPSVSYDYTERAQTLEGKVVPQVVRGRVPRTVTGEVDVNQLPDFPSITVQAISAKVETEETHVTVRIFFHAYDENPDSQGYQDLLNMIEAAAIALTTFGQGAIDQAYPIVMPLEWRLHEENNFPHYIGEMTSLWQLPSGRPLPDAEITYVPGEQFEVVVEKEDYPYGDSPLAP